MKSPLRYPGGKTRAIKIIEKKLSERTNLSQYNSLVSPFFGGGSVELYLSQKYDYDVSANDKYMALISFWNSIKTNPISFVERVKNNLPIGKEKFNSFVSDLNSGKNVDLSFYIINRCSFSGTSESGGFSKEASEKRLTSSIIKKILDIKLEKITFSNSDFSDFIGGVKFDDKTLMFLDPPYFIESKLYGKKGNLQTNFNHKKLYEILSDKKNWILCYNDCEYIRKLYSDFEIETLSWSYSMNKSKKSSEIIITNFSEKNI